MEYAALAGLGMLGYMAYGQIKSYNNTAAYNPALINTRSDLRAIDRMKRGPNRAPAHAMNEGYIPNIRPSASTREISESVFSAR